MDSHVCLTGVGMTRFRGDADGRQVDCETGLAVNVAGFGNNAVCTILEVAE